MIRMAYVISVIDENGDSVNLAGVEFNSHESAIAFAKELRANRPELDPVAIKVMRRAK